jgi:hypothetical protein
MLEVTNFIKKTFENDQFFDAVIWSDDTKGVGKSVFVLLLLKDVYGDYTEVFKHIWFSPIPFLRRVEYYLDNDIRTPLEVFDDASMYLSKRDWNDNDIRIFGRVYNAIRECTGAMLFTSPNWDDISKDIREEIKHYGEVTKVDENSTIREVRFYKCKQSIFDKSRKYPKIVEETFDLTHLPIEYYNHYRTMKKRALKDLIREALKGKRDGRDEHAYADSIEELAKRCGLKRKDVKYALRRNEVKIADYKVGNLTDELNYLYAKNYINEFPQLLKNLKVEECQH